MSNLQYYTQDGLGKLKKELQELKTKGRSKMAKQIAELETKEILAKMQNTTLQKKPKAYWNYVYLS